MAFYNCFHRNAPVTFQALADGDRKLWMEAMDGKEPVSLLCFYLVKSASPIVSSATAKPHLKICNNPVLNVQFSISLFMAW